MGGLLEGWGGGGGGRGERVCPTQIFFLGGGGGGWPPYLPPPLPTPMSINIFLFILSGPLRHIQSTLDISKSNSIPY